MALHTHNGKLLTKLMLLTKAVSLLDIVSAKAGKGTRAYPLKSSRGRGDPGALPCWCAHLHAQKPRSVVTHG